jgi:hypothetical protein
MFKIIKPVVGSFATDYVLMTGGSFLTDNLEINFGKESDRKIWHVIFPSQ